MTARSPRLLLSLLVLLFLFAGRQRVAGTVPTPPQLHGLPEDVYSWAQPAAVTVRHLELDLAVDFQERVLRGTAVLHIHNLSGASTLVLDTKGLAIESVALDAGQPALWSMGAQTPFGAPMTIGITPATSSVTITYATSPTASGLHWNTAEQTLGRREPYLYTQNEAIDARSWIPLQDTPAVRMTYEATLRVPPSLLALMSAENPTAIDPDGVYEFAMRTPIPAYLISLAVGRLEFRELGPRSGVYAEPELIDDAAWELQYVPRMIELAESIAGPYPFERYDLLMMPPTYIVGGMEHPQLNFINPAIISGNRPAVPVPSTLVAHELAHSWAGDLTTLATWADVWLNEGLTSYLELRIIEELSGTRRIEYEWFNDRRGFAELAKLPQHGPATILHRETGPTIHPNSFFNAAAYVKGALFFRMLEDELGRHAMDAFVREYFRRFRLRWVDDAQFLAFLRSAALGNDSTLDSRLRLEEWIYGMGLPSNVTAPTNSALYDDVAARAESFRAGGSAMLPAGWTSVESDLFLSLIGNAAYARMAELDATHGLSDRVTPPFAWLAHSIRSSYAPGLAALDRILMRGGPNSWMTSLYRMLAETPEGKTLARTIFERAKARYHPAVRAEVEMLLAPPASGTSTAWFESGALVGEEAVGIRVALVRLQVLGVDELPLRHVVELGKERVAFELGVDTGQVHAISAVQGLGVDLCPAADEDLFISRSLRLADRLVDGSRHRHAHG